MKKFFNSIGSFVLLVGLICGCVYTDVLAINEQNALGENVNDEDIYLYDSVFEYNDVIDSEKYEIDENDIDSSDEVIEPDDLMVFEKNYTSALYNGTWDKYSSRYYYNQLSPEKKEVWDRLDALAYSYLDGSRKNADFGTITLNNGEAYVLGEVSCEKNGKCVFSSQSEIDLFINMFRVSNPQYYFITNSRTIRVRNNSDIISFYLGVYESFANATDRTTATNTFRTKIESWVNEIGSATSETDKLTRAKNAHDKIRANVQYNHTVVDENGDGASNLTHEEEEMYYTQSAYSAVVNGITVCTGYSEAYQLLCNAVGIDAVCITSDTHAWNQIRANNSWYNVDCTWDDSVNGYLYFMQSDSDYMNDSIPENAQAHIHEQFWDDYCPPCTQSIGSTRYVAGTQLPQPVATVAKPTFNVVKNSSNYSVTLNDETKGAKIYYTTDGTTPSVGYSKSSICNTGTTITVTDYKNVKAIAVKDKYLDSEVATASAFAPADTGSGSGSSSQQPSTTANTQTAKIDSGVSMYRLYNPNSGEHFYTANAGEMQYLSAIGWNYEGIGWTAPSTGTPVYRMYNPNVGDHHYTTNWAEVQMLKNAGWNYEGEAWKSGGSVKMLRAYNPNAVTGTHHYTSNPAELRSIVAVGWRDEGYGWYALR